MRESLLYLCAAHRGASSNGAECGALACVRTMIQWGERRWHGKRGGAIYSATPAVANSAESGGGSPDSQSLTCVGSKPSVLSFHRPSIIPPKLIRQ